MSSYEEPRGFVASGMLHRYFLFHFSIILIFCILCSETENFTGLETRARIDQKGDACRCSGFPCIEQMRH